MLKQLGFIATLIFVMVLRPAHANVVGADTQNFNPTNDGLDFVTVHSSETLTPGLLNLGIFLNYAVNTLPNYVDLTTQTRANFRDSLLSSDVNFALGLMPGWEAGVSFPAVLNQSLNDDGNVLHGQFTQTGLTEFRVMTKLRFWGDQDKGIGAVFSANFNEIGDDPFLGAGAGPTYNAELVADTSLDKFALGANVGYRKRNPGSPLNVPIQPLQDQFIASAAASYLITDWDTKIITEVFGSVPTKSQQFTSDRSVSSAEWLLGFKHDISRSVAWHAGAGTELLHGTASPDWRVYTGINWVIGPLFSKPREVIVKVQDQPLRSLEDIETADPFEGKPDAREAFIARDVLFEFNSDQLQADAEESLKRFVDYVKKPPGFKSVTIEGHTDSVGKPAYNLSLSQRRANTVRASLIRFGLPSDKVRAVGYGMTRPIADNGNYQGRAMNRRVEFKVQR